MMMPELILAKAINDRMAAEEWNSGTPKKDRRPVRNYLANMGYFVLEWEGVEGETQHAPDIEASIPGEEPNPTLARRYHEVKRVVDSLLAPSRNNGLLESSASSYINATRFRSRYWALNARQWAYLRELGIAELPDTPEHQLQLNDSGGALIKIIALVQIFWLVLQIVVRHFAEYPSAQLEVAALAFAAQSAVTYGLNFPMPHDVAAVFVIKACGRSRIHNTDLDHKDMLYNLASMGPTYLWTRARLPLHFDTSIGPAPIPNDGTHDLHASDGFVSGRGVFSMLMMAIGGFIFGGIHCFAWNATYPSSGERIAWRICAIITAALPLIPLVVCAVPYFLQKLGSRTLRKAADAGSNGLGTKLYGRALRLIEFRYAITGMGMGTQAQKSKAKFFGLCILVPYTLARLFLIVEMFRALFYSPPEVYKTTWTAEFLHF